jgi:hypothetical protein
VEGVELDVLKGARDILSNSNDIRLLIEIHGQDNYKPLVDFLVFYNFRIEFEKTYDSGDKHVILRKKVE